MIYVLLGMTIGAGVSAGAFFITVAILEVIQ